MTNPEARDGIDRLERLTNLVLFLLHASGPVTIHEICSQVAGYPAGGDPVAMRQRFERDKKLLRDEGIEIRVEPVPSETQLGYSIHPEDFFLPDLGLTPDEQSALGIAMTAVHVDESSSRDVLSKLGISLVPVPSVSADLPVSPLLPGLHDAIHQRSQVRFTYRGRERTVDPYGLLCRGGAWYLFGWDHLRGERRTFRVDRIEGDVASGDPGSYALPPDFDPQDALPSQPWQVGEGGATTVRVEIGPVLSPLVTATLGEDRVETHLEDGSIVVSLEVVNLAALREWVLGMAQHARVLSPTDVVAHLVGWLDEIIASGDSGSNGVGDVPGAGSFVERAPAAAERNEAR